LERAKLSIQDWQDFIKVILDYYIRENTVIDLAEEWKQWMVDLYALSM
jgi:hypothetical protein